MARKSSTSTNDSKRRAAASLSTGKLQIAQTMVDKDQIMPPDNVPLSPEALPFFRSVLKELTSAELTPHALELCALVARAMCDLEQESRQLSSEGYVIRHPTKGVVANPRQNAVDRLDKRVLDIRRALGIFGGATAAKVNEASAARSARPNALAAERNFAALGGEDDLLAHPLN